MSAKLTTQPVKKPIFIGQVNNNPPLANRKKMYLKINDTISLGFNSLILHRKLTYKAIIFENLVSLPPPILVIG